MSAACGGSMPREREAARSRTWLAPGRSPRVSLWPLGGPQTTRQARDWRFYFRSEGNTYMLLDIMPIRNSRDIGRCILVREMPMQPDDVNCPTCGRRWGACHEPGVLGML
jgi:hypothetical protein